jgi:fatty-acid desaturase
VVWAVFGRIVLVLHATSLVNSAAHLWGYRSYSTPEHSRNNWWVALASLGEGWHNNHHGRPAAANQGFHRWWEFDLSFVVLLGLAGVGLAHDLRVYRPRSGKTELWFRRPSATSPSLP